MNEVCWGELDYLLIDTPPGTSDEHLAVMENIRSMNFEDFSAILVTTPQVNSQLCGKINFYNRLVFSIFVRRIYRLTT